MFNVGRICCLAAIVVVGIGTLGVARAAERIRLDCEVLEVSGKYQGNARELGAIRYVMIRHKNPADRQRLSDWLKTHSGSDVVFTGPDGRSHSGVMRRLKMCFGRGLLIFTDPLEINEGAVLSVEIP
jgi:hypothetical protein